MRERRLLESFLPIGEVMEEARRKRLGPPLDPRAAAYSHALLLARGVIYRETIARRRPHVLRAFEERIAQIERSVSNCKTLGDQLVELERALDPANWFGLDLRTLKERKGPEDEVLLTGYQEVHSLLKTILGRYRGRDFEAVENHIRAEFPEVSEEQAGEAAYYTPSWASYVVLGARHGLLPERVRDRISAARRRQKAGPADRSRGANASSRRKKTKRRQRLKK
jgi:hypothetical protein